MARLEYIGEPDRVFPTLGIRPEPGEIYELPFDADDVFWKVPDETGSQPVDEHEPLEEPQEVEPEQSAADPTVHADHVDLAQVEDVKATDNGGAVPGDSSNANVDPTNNGEAARIGINPETSVEEHSELNEAETERRETETGNA